MGIEEYNEKCKMGKEERKEIKWREKTVSNENKKKN